VCLVSRYLTSKNPFLFRHRSLLIFSLLSSKSTMIDQPTILRIWLSLMALSHVFRHAFGQQDFLCNICGCLNCTFANGQGIVNFFYDGQNRQNNCANLQQATENPSTINTNYCRTELWKLAFEPCRCYNFVTDLELTEIPSKCVLYCSCETYSSCHVNCKGLHIGRNSHLTLFNRLQRPRIW
jgi:hypothetical protein